MVGNGGEDVDAVSAPGEGLEAVADADLVQEGDGLVQVEACPVIEVTPVVVAVRVVEERHGVSNPCHSSTFVGENGLCRASKVKGASRFYDHSRAVDEVACFTNNKAVVYTVRPDCPDVSKWVEGRMCLHRPTLALRFKALLSLTATVSTRSFILLSIVRHISSKPPADPLFLRSACTSPTAERAEDGSARRAGSGVKNEG